MSSGLRTYNGKIGKDCPFCGCGPSEKDTPKRREWKCGSHYTCIKPWQSANCYVNELEAEIEKKDTILQELAVELDDVLLVMDDEPLKKDLTAIRNKAAGGER